MSPWTTATREDEVEAKIGKLDVGGILKRAKKVNR